MNLSQRIAFEDLMEPVALRLLGEPNQRLSKPPKEIRFGTHGSMAVDYQAGKFYDHEVKKGGGVIDLIKHKTGCDHANAVIWLRREGLLPGSQPTTPRPELKSVTTEPPPPTIAATYDYIDEAGMLLFQVVRFEPKTFKQRKRDRSGSWDWKLGNVRRVPFKLPELIEGIAAGHPVLIVEGERDVLTLNELGVVATTNAGGAGKWRAEFSQYFRGADVILVPDNDDAGWEHINQIGAQLSGVAARLRVLVLPNLPPKGDVSDWIASGGTREQFDALVAKASDWKSPQAAADKNEAKTKATAKEDELIASLAKMEPGIQFARERARLAKDLGVRSSDIDAEVKARREDAEVAPLYGHWIVEPWPEVADGDALLRDIIRRIRRQVVISDDSALASALFVMLGWVHDEVATHSPILNINSAEPESGKSTLMGLIAFLMPRCIASVDATEAAIYRAIKRWQPSFCIDEFDSVLADDSKAALRSRDQQRPHARPRRTALHWR